MDYNAILKWAAGSIKPLPTTLEFDEEVLIGLIDLHNLSGRFLQKLANHDAPYFTPEFKEAVNKLHLQTKKRVIQNMNAVREINKKLPASTKLIVIKGFSAHVLTGEENVMRSGDIDIVCNNAEILVDTLSNMGYRQTRTPFLHEVGEYTKGDIEIDIHNHFPVYFYPDLILNADLMPHNNSGIWQQNYKIKQRKITYNDLSNNSFQGGMPNATHITVADPNILSIIICAHAFMNYTNIWSISHRRKAYVRLGEIADLFDLANHKFFNNKKFLSLVKQFDAKDAVEWAANTAFILFGKNPLPVPDKINFSNEFPYARFPRCLWWNFWASIPCQTDNLIQKYWLSMQRLSEELGSTTLTVKRGTTGKYATFKYKGSRSLQRFISQNINPIKLILEVSKIKTGIIIRLKALSDSNADINRVRIDFGHESSEWIYSVNSRTQTLVGAPADISFDRRGANYEINFKCPWKTLGQYAHNSKKAALLIGVGEQSRRGKLTNSVLIPLIINFQ